MSLTLQANSAGTNSSSAGTFVCILGPSPKYAWNMNTGFDRAGDPRFVGFSIWSDGQTLVDLHWFRVNLPVAGIGAGMFFAVILAILLLGFRRRRG